MLKIKKSISLSAAFLILLMTGCSGKKDISVKDMEVEHLKNSLCIDIQNPRFSWKITSSLNNISQNAWQVCVADSPDKLRSEREQGCLSQGLDYMNVSLTGKKSAVMCRIRKGYWYLKQ
jgi:alpha-L-rhamnosidase